MEVEPCSLEDLGRHCRCTYGLCKLPSHEHSMVLVIAFDGEASPSFAYMDAMIAAGKAGWDPVALLLDLRKLRYEWGDEMGRTLSDAKASGFERQLPLAVVVSELNRAGLTSLIRDELFGKPEQWLCDSLEAALAMLDLAKP